MKKTKTKKSKATTKDALNGKKTSEILKLLPEQCGSTTTLDQIKKTLSSRSYSILLLVLAIPTLIPLPTPGLSAVIGVPLVIVTFQFMIGIKSPWFPKFISRKKIKCEDMTRVFKRFIPYLEKLEIFTKPRLSFLTKPPIDRFIALICFLLSLVITLAVPFGNALPALAICLFALSILQQDGILAIVAVVVTLFSATVILAFVSGFFSLVTGLFGL